MFDSRPHNNTPRTIFNTVLSLGLLSGAGIAVAKMCGCEPDKKNDALSYVVKETDAYIDHGNGLVSIKAKGQFVENLDIWKAANPHRKIFEMPAYDSNTDRQQLVTIRTIERKAGEQ